MSAGDGKFRLGWAERLLVLVFVILLAGGLGEISRALFCLARVMATGEFYET